MKRPEEWSAVIDRLGLSDEPLDVRIKAATHHAAANLRYFRWASGAKKRMARRLRMARKKRRGW